MWIKQVPYIGFTENEVCALCEKYGRNLYLLQKRRNGMSWLSLSGSRVICWMRLWIWKPVKWQLESRRFIQNLRRRFSIIMKTHLAVC